jgi:hydroxyacylglutathione hydrolase
MPDIIDYQNGISAVDSGYVRPHHDAIHLIVESGRAAIIESGVNSSVARVLDALAQKGLRPADVDYLILTHIHLDHAGGAGLLMSKLPNARLTVHPRGAAHMVNPAKLIGSAEQVYGVDNMRALYGEILPVEAGRIIETPHESSVSLAGRRLQFFDTPGHARHHVCVQDEKTGHVFTGDTFGLSYREFDRNGRQFILPTSSPVQFDPAAAHRSADLITGLRPEAAYVTHYSQVREIGRLGDDLHRLLNAYESLALGAGPADPARHQWLKQGMTEIVLKEARQQGWGASSDVILEILGVDIELNAQGLAIWLDGRNAIRA